MIDDNRRYSSKSVDAGDGDDNGGDADDGHTDDKVGEELTSLA